MGRYSSSIACILHSDGVTPAGAGMVLDQRRVLTCSYAVEEAIGGDHYDYSGIAKAVVPVTVPARAGGDEVFEMEALPSRWGRLPTMGGSMYAPFAMLQLRHGAVFPVGVAPAPIMGAYLRSGYNRRIWLAGFSGGRNLRLTGELVMDNVHQDLSVDAVTRAKVLAGAFCGTGVWDEEIGGFINMLVVKRQPDGTTRVSSPEMGVFIKVIGHENIQLNASAHQSPPRTPRHYVHRNEDLGKRP